MWAVTVTGAPKLWAMRFIESRERSPRRWYGGAFGRLGFDGDADTGLTLRTVHVSKGVAETRAGGTLLIDSDADAEEAETEIKASAFLDALTKPVADSPLAATVYEPSAGSKPRLLLVDHEDSFVHTLANYFRQAGAEVQTVRAPLKRDELAAAIESFNPAMLVLSPGPGRPSDFALGTSIEVALEYDLAIFGVCLGLQGMVEHFGGTLGLLDYPMHGQGFRRSRSLVGSCSRGCPRCSGPAVTTPSSRPRCPTTWSARARRRQRRRHGGRAHLAAGLRGAVPSRVDHERRR